MSRLSPKTNPSYQYLTSAILSPSPYSPNEAATSSSVNPKLSAYISDVVVTTARLFKSEKMDSLLTRVIPVIIALSRYGLVLNVELNRFLVNETNSSQYPPT